MSLTTSSCICVTILLLLSGVLGVKDWKVTYEKPHICALKGSSVTIPCSYQYPRGHRVNETFWTNERETNKEPEDLKKNSEYHNRVTYLGDVFENCTFRIENVGERDSATYWFRFVTDKVGGKWIGEPGVTLSVTALQVEKSQQSATGQATLTCKNTCFPKVHNDYVWFRDGKYVLNQYESVLVPEENGKYSCALRRSENVQSAPVKVSMEYSPKNTSVSVSPSGEILEGSSVTLTCNNKANPPVYRYTWFKNGAEISQSGSQKNYYTITNIRSEDSGKYRCVARNTHGTGTSELYSVDVQYSPKNTLVSISPSGDILEGSSVTLTCNSKANPPVDTYTWFKNGAEISQRGSWQDYDIINITSEDTGRYYCNASNRYGTGTSTLYTVDVQYSPKNTSVSVSPPGDIVEGSSVTLTCNSKANPPVDTYIWFKNGAEISRRESWQDYNITNITSEDSGQYYCNATHSLGTRSSALYTVNVVYAPKNTLVLVTPSGDIKKGATVILTCSSKANPPVNTYTWFKNGAKISQRGQNYTITNIKSADSGKYHCVVRNKVGTDMSNHGIVNVDGNQAIVIGSVGGITAVMVLVVLIIVVCKSRGKCSKATKETGSTQHGEDAASPVYANVSGMPMRPTDQQDLTLYSTVQPHSKSSKDVLYSTVQQPYSHNEDELQYCSIQFPTTSTGSRSAVQQIQDNSVIYSTVSKK
ncbi:B-cell receptor CD22-like isoform X2 [Scleropages formosus]|uniref:B-cell receptor CD22-like isoform X2 n=1 Tax=Scleropages formosus TaxID=113540 RepID=UPI0010FAC7AB|nr:B-cell receptor CD22-like isoform X2 [Scleropages formosus]